MPFAICCPAKTIGRPGRSSCSFPKAIRLPEKLIEPIRAEKSIAPMCSGRTCPTAGVSRWNSAAAMRAAAPPPTPLNSATICGIAVIFTVRAEATPITVPTATPAAISQYESISGLRSVKTTAIVIPTAATTLPERAVAGEDSRLMPTIRQTPATRYARLIVVWETARITRVPRAGRAGA